MGRRSGRRVAALCLAAAALAVSMPAAASSSSSPALSMMELEGQVWLHERDCPRMCDLSCMCATSHVAEGHASLAACHANCEKCLFAGIPCGTHPAQRLRHKQQAQAQAQQTQLNPRFVEIAHAARAAEAQQQQQKQQQKQQQGRRRADPAAAKEFQNLVQGLKQQKIAHEASTDKAAAAGQAAPVPKHAQTQTQARSAAEPAEPSAAAVKAAAEVAKVDAAELQAKEKVAATEAKASPAPAKAAEPAKEDTLAEAAEAAEVKEEADEEKARLGDEEKKVESEERKLRETEEKEREEERKLAEERKETPAGAEEQRKDHEHLVRLDERLARVVELQEELLKAVRGHEGFDDRLNDAVGHHRHTRHHHEPSEHRRHEEEEHRALGRIVRQLEHLAEWVRERHDGEADWAAPEHVEEILAHAVTLAEGHH